MLDRRGVELFSITIFLESNRQQSVLSAPVSKIVDPVHWMLIPLVNVAQKVAQKSGSHMASVQRLGYIRRTELDQSDRRLFLETPCTELAVNICCLMINSLVVEHKSILRFLLKNRSKCSLTKKEKRDDSTSVCVSNKQT